MILTFRTHLIHQPFVCNGTSCTTQQLLLGYQTQCPIQWVTVCTGVTVKIYPLQNYTTSIVSHMIVHKIIPPLLCAELIQQITGVQKCNFLTLVNSQM